MGYTDELLLTSVTVNKRQARDNSFAIVPIQLTTIVVTDRTSILSYIKKASIFFYFEFSVILSVS